MNVEVSPRSLFIESSSWLNARMVLEVTLLFTRSSSALVIFNVMVLPLMAHVPRIVPVTPWESVLLMNPWGRNCATKVPPPLKVIDSFMLPTVPSQLPTILALYSVSATGFAGVQDQTPKANARSRPSRTKLKLCFIGIFSYQVLLVAASRPQSVAGTAMKRSLGREILSALKMTGS